ncbi:MAG TPA: hypothetical protein VEK07_03920 [Polyangiaceae bacterium]|nr:hypothetical protein [Polyangiaceae bacterium]
MSRPLHRIWIATAGIAIAFAAGRDAQGADPAPLGAAPSHDGEVAGSGNVTPKETESGPPVDVKLTATPPPHRTLTVEWNPVALVISRVMIPIVVVPADHHALVVSPYYTWASTVPYATGIDAEGAQLPNTLNVLSQSFHGYGAELGYRYYLDKGGPRGFFAGPSLILSAITAKAGNGSETSFADLGGAVDIGYEALVANTIAITLGGGVQYTAPTKSIPTQQWPASIYANDGVRPRLLVSVGYAL